MSCPAKHVKVEIPDECWRCPKCGRHNDDAGTGRIGVFVIEEPDENASGECTLLHEEDYLGCHCGYGVSGRLFSAAYAKRLNMVTCTHCKGKGVVDGRK